MTVTEATQDPDSPTAAIDRAPHSESGPAGGHATSTGLSNEKLAMWVFLGSECLLFGGLISTFLLLRSREIVDQVGPDVAELYDIPFTSVSSFVLLMSSLTMVLALAAAQRNDQPRLRTWLATTALLGATFVAGQVYEFTAFVREGLGLTDIVIAPHVDNPDFGEGCRKAGDLCERDGYSVVRLTDAQAVVIDGGDQRVVEG